MYILYNSAYGHRFINSNFICFSPSGLDFWKFYFRARSFLTNFKTNWNLVRQLKSLKNIVGVISKMYCFNITVFYLCTINPRIGINENCNYFSCNNAYQYWGHFASQYATSRQTSHISHPTSWTPQIWNVPHPEHSTLQTSHIPSIPHPRHTTSRTSHIPNNPHPKHSTSWTSLIPNTPYAQHGTFRTSHIPNIPYPKIPRPEHPTSQTSHIPNIPHSQHTISLILHMTRISSSLSTSFKHSFINTDGQKLKSNTGSFVV